MSRKGKILVSACLCGRPCRYDGRGCLCTHPLFQQWQREGRLIPVCPEQSAGLSVPREPMEWRENRLITVSGTDQTELCREGTERTVRIAREVAAVLCILKEKSPTCGSSVIYDGSFSGRKIPGEGMAAAALRQAGFPVFSEESFSEAEDEIRWLLSRSDESLS